MEWEKFERGVFLVNVLGIVYDKERKKIIIGRRENDPYIQSLSWTFPGGRPDYENSLEESLKREIKKKTGLDVKVIRQVFSRILEEEKKFMLIYYYCEVAGGEAEPGEKFVEIKWIRPTEVKDYFTTSLHPSLYRFLEGLENEE